MRAFIRDNPTIVFGLGLPLLLVLAILVFSVLPALFVPPPQYDVVYATGYNAAGSVVIEVVHNKAEVTYTGSRYYANAPRVWHYNAKTGSVQEISVHIPTDAAPVPANAPLPRPVAIKAPELQALHLESTTIAPDGYEFKYDTGYRSPDLTGLLMYSHYDREPALVKGTRSIRLPQAGNGYSYDAKFIGWVVPQ